MNDTQEKTKNAKRKHNTIITITTMSEPQAGLSKNEQKKLAKKAEKAAKKAAMKGGGGAPAQDNAKAGSKPSTAAPANAPAATIPTTQLPKAPKVLLYNGAKDDPATLKVVYAALHYEIEVGVAKKKDLPQGCLATSSKSILVYGSGDYVLGGGGNAMCKAIALMAGEALSFEADEWCEVERNTLRTVDAKKPLKLDALAAALENSATGVHLVGDMDTCADICILVTLSKYADGIASWPGKSFWKLLIMSTAKRGSNHEKDDIDHCSWHRSKSQHSIPFNDQC